MLHLQLGGKHRDMDNQTSYLYLALAARFSKVIRNGSTAITLSVWEIRTTRFHSDQIHTETPQHLDIAVVNVHRTARMRQTMRYVTATNQYFVKSFRHRGRSNSVVCVIRLCSNWVAVCRVQSQDFSWWEGRRIFAGAQQLPPPNDSIFLWEHLFSMGCALRPYSAATPLHMFVRYTPRIASSQKSSE